VVAGLDNCGATVLEDVYVHKHSTSAPSPQVKEVETFLSTPGFLDSGPTLDR
jgi:hypothetical protein